MIEKINRNLEQEAKQIISEGFRDEKSLATLFYNTYTLQV